MDGRWIPGKVIVYGTVCLGRLKLGIRLVQDNNKGGERLFYGDYCNILEYSFPVDGYG